MEVYSVNETASILKISRVTLINLLTSQKIKSVRAGKRWLITADAIKDFLKNA